MKVILTSDTHGARGSIKKVTEFAKETGIETIIDCGDLHGEIDAYNGIKLHAVYWQKAADAMKRWHFSEDIERIGGNMHENGSTFTIDDTAIFIQHNLAGYETQIPEDSFERAKTKLDMLVEGADREMKKLVLFGHTHDFHYCKQDDVLALNPGALISGFIVLDLDTQDVEYRTFDATVLRIDNAHNTDVTQIKNLIIDRDGSIAQSVLRLNNGNEVFVVNGEISPEYPRINLVQPVNYNLEMPITLDNIALTVTKENGKEVLLFQGEESKEYDKLLSFKKVFENKDYKKGKLFLHAVRDDKHLMVGLDGRETEGYDRVGAVNLLDGEIYFVAKIAEDRQALVKGYAGSSEELLQCKEIKNYELLNGEIAAIVKNDEGNMLVNFRGEESQAYAQIRDVILLDGKLAFIAGEGIDSFVVVDGEELTRHSGFYSTVSDVQIIQGVPTYILSTREEQQVIQDGSMVAGPFSKSNSWSDSINLIYEYEGKLCVDLKEK